MLLRALIVLSAYALSAAGFMFMIAGAFPFLGGDYPLLAKLVPLVWVFAWVAHARMSIAWVRDVTVPRRWPVWGTAAGVFSLASPLLLLIGGTPATTLSHVQGASSPWGWSRCSFCRASGWPSTWFAFISMAKGRNGR